MYNSETMQAIDEIYSRMPYQWEKWEKRVDNTEKDLVELLQDALHGHFPEKEY
jgi:hypothetical protein